MGALLSKRLQFHGHTRHYANSHRQCLKTMQLAEQPDLPPFHHVCPAGTNWYVALLLLDNAKFVRVTVVLQECLQKWKHMLAERRAASDASPRQ
jgi:hypothetical protein